MQNTFCFHKTFKLQSLFHDLLNQYYCTWKSCWDDHAALFELSVSRSRDLLHCCYGWLNYAPYAMPRIPFIRVSKTIPATIGTFVQLTELIIHLVSKISSKRQRFRKRSMLATWWQERAQFQLCNRSSNRPSIRQRALSLHVQNILISNHQYCFVTHLNAFSMMIPTKLRTKS